MNDRDFDHTVAGWLAEGAERAPEWAVWSALDQIAVTAQRPRWRRRLDDLLHRLVPPTRLSVVAAAILVVAVVYTMFAELPRFGGTSRTFTVQHLTEIVVWEDTMPRDWTLDNLASNPFDVMTVPVRSMSATEFVEREELGGYIGGRYTDFSGPDAVFISWATVFESAPQANAALEAYRFEIQSQEGWGLGPGAQVQLGDEGHVMTGETRVLMGSPPGDPVPMQLYLWRTSNLVLAVAGWFEYDPEQLRDVAEAMDGRAR